MVTFILFHWQQVIRKRSTDSQSTKKQLQSWKVSLPFRSLSHKRNVYFFLLFLSRRIYIFMSTFICFSQLKRWSVTHTPLCVFFHRTNYLGDVYRSICIAASFFYWLHNIALRGCTTDYLRDPYLPRCAIKNNATLAIDDHWGSRCWLSSVSRVPLLPDNRILQRPHFPTALTTRCGHVTNFWS